MYKVTENKLSKCFEKINQEVFDGLLAFEDIDSVEVEFLDTEWGYCVDEDGEIVLGITDEFPTRADFMNTLAHEMIHLFQITNSLKVNHGVAFERIAQHARPFGYIAH